ncbi:MAG: nuclear transport factor 2 family protein, partial [Ilumatobacter sp.]|nr:nuclear transport factor 2 family protein [Ilumatobacter sp.]
MGTTDDRTAITETLQRYGWTIDQFDWAAVGAVFTDDADVRYGSYPPLVGGEATA